MPENETQEKRVSIQIEVREALAEWLSARAVKNLRARRREIESILESEYSKSQEGAML